MLRRFTLALALVVGVLPLAGRAQAPAVRVLRPARVYDGVAMHDGWIVVVRGKSIEAAGPPASVTVPAGAEVVALPALTLMPGMVEGHSHLLCIPTTKSRGTTRCCASRWRIAWRGRR